MRVGLRNRAVRPSAGPFPVKLRDVRVCPSRLSGDFVLGQSEGGKETGISLEIRAGEFVGIVGPNGAGKSTLLRVIAGEAEGVRGEVMVAGMTVNRPIREVVKGVGIVHQREQADLVEHLSVFQNLAVRQILGGGHRNRVLAVSKEWEREYGPRLTSQTQITEIDWHGSVSRLSGGQKQRVAIAVAIHFEHELNPCGLLLLDEHTARLDVRAARETMDYTKKAIRTSGITAVMVTHRFEEAVKACDRLVFLRDGLVEGDFLSSE